MEDTSRSRRVLLLFLGICAGFLSGFLGIGGGLVIVPALMLLFEFPIKRAVGISLATIVPVSIVAVLADLQLKPGNIHWMMAVALTAGSFLGSVIGARLLRRLPDIPLRMLFAGALLVAAYKMLPAFTAWGDGVMLFSEHTAVADILALPIGALAGITSTLFGLGGGIITVPCLQVLFRDFPFHAARATSLVTIAPTSGFGAFQHQRMGTVDFAVVRRLVPTALVGAVLGVVCVNVVPAAACRAVFAGLLVVTAARLLMTGQPAPATGTPVGASAGGERGRRVKFANTYQPGRGDMNARLRRLTGRRVVSLALVGVATAALGAASLVATTPDEGPAAAVSSRSLRRHVELLNQALAGNHIGLAAFTWQDAYALLLASRQWESALLVGDAALAIGDASGSRIGWTSRARDCYSLALFRARRQASLDGALEATRRLSILGDDEATARGIAVAWALAKDAESRGRVQEVVAHTGEPAFARAQVASPRP